MRRGGGAKREWRDEGREEKKRLNKERKGGSERGEQERRRSKEGLEGRRRE